MAESGPAAMPLPAERVIGEEGLRVDGGRLRLAVRLPWYRSLPLSTVSFEALSLDGEAVDLGDARLELDGETYTTAQMAEATDRFWFILDSAWLSFPGSGAKPGDVRETALTTVIQPPYIPGLRRANPQVARLKVQP